MGGQNLPACKDCRYFNDDVWTVFGSICEHDDVRVFDNVYGLRPVAARLARAKECGPEGKLFAQRPKRVGWFRRLLDSLPGAD